MNPRLVKFLSYLGLRPRTGLDPYAAIGARASHKRSEERQREEDLEVRDHSGENPHEILGLIESGRSDEAERRLRHRLSAAPDDVDALHILGLLCHQSGRNTDAIALIGRAVTLAPEVAFMQANFAETLRAQGDLERAERHAREAVRLTPEHADFRFNLANVLAGLRRHAEVIEAIEPVLAAQPERVEALTLKSDACFELERTGEALELAARAHRLAPDNIGLLTKLMRLRAWLCEWETRPADVAMLVALLEKGVAQSAALTASPLDTGAPTIDGVAAADAAASHGALHGLNPFVTYEYPVPQALRDAVTQLHADGIIRTAGAPLVLDLPAARANRRHLRIGYVSADFHSHPTMHLMASFFALHDRERFEVFAYSIGPDDHSDYRHRARSTMDRFVDIRGETPRQSAERMLRDDIDILVDLKGFTHEARPGIFALRPAPLRVAWLGYPASTGIGLNDYAIVDHVTVPPAIASQFGEKLVWMPHSYQVNDHRQQVAAVAPTRLELGLPLKGTDGTGFVFACFNHVYKIEPEVFASWMRILGRVPGSVLWLYCSNAAARGNLAREAAARGIDATRLVFGGTLDKPSHLARLACADLFLDTGRINAHTSASDALWAGLPVLTRPGDAFTSRVAASLVSAAGLPQLACDSVQAYEDRAVQLANEPAELAAMRDTLNARAQLPLFDAPRFTRNLEKAYETMWARYLKGLPPASFAVENDHAVPFALQNRDSATDKLSPY